MSKKLWIGLGILVSGIVLSVTMFVINSSKEVAEKTFDADHVIANYEQFKDDYNGAKAVAQNVKMAEESMSEIQEMYGEPDTWDKDTRKEYNFQKQTRDGLLMQYQSIVKTYNANSEKLNRNLFKDSDLPYALPLDISELN